MNAKLYNDLIDESFFHQFKEGLQGCAREANGIAIFSTSLDLGRMTCKTTAAVERTIRDSQRGIFTYYVGPNMNMGFHFRNELKKRVNEHELKCAITSAKSKNFLDATRGVIQPGQAISVVFDECGLSHSEQHEFVKAIILQMQRADALHPFRYIHVIRLGM